jgi:hypothetical protein
MGQTNGLLRIQLAVAVAGITLLDSGVQYTGEAGPSGSSIVNLRKLLPHEAPFFIPANIEINVIEQNIWRNLGDAVQHFARVIFENETNEVYKA